MGQVLLDIHQVCATITISCEVLEEQERPTVCHPWVTPPRLKYFMAFSSSQIPVRSDCLSRSMLSGGLVKGGSILLSAQRLRAVRVCHVAHAVSLLPLYIGSRWTIQSSVAAESAATSLTTGPWHGVSLPCRTPFWKELEAKRQGADTCQSCATICTAINHFCLWFCSPDYPQLGISNRTVLTCLLWSHSSEHRDNTWRNVITEIRS